MEDYGIANKLSRICSENYISGNKNILKYSSLNKKNKLRWKCSNENCNKEFAATPMSILKNPQCLCESCNNEGKTV